MDAKKILSFAIGPIATAALGFVTLPVITWFYSTEDVGRIAMLQVASSFCILFFSLGLDQAYVREFHETESKAALLGAAILPGLLLLLFSMLILWLWKPELISYGLFNVKSTAISLLVSLCLISSLISRFLSLVLRMREHGLAYSLSQVLPKLIFASIIGAYVYLSLGFDLLHLVIALTLSNVVTVAALGWNTREDWLGCLREGIDRRALAGLLSFGLPLIVGGLAFWGLTTMDRLFLRKLSTFDELGIYSVASSFSAIAIIFHGVFSVVWAPIVYKWAAEGVDLKKIDRVTEHVLGAIVLLLSLAGLFSWVVIPLLPDKYEDVQYILVACMACPLFYTLSETTVVGLGIVRKSSYAMLAAILAAFINFMLCYWLVPRYGAAGAASATAISFWCFLFLRTEFSSRIWRRLPRFKIYASTLVCLVTSVIFTMKGRDVPMIMFYGWLALLAVFGISFSSSISVATARLRSTFSSKVRI